MSLYPCKIIQLLHTYIFLNFLLGIFQSILHLGWKTVININNSPFLFCPCKADTKLQRQSNKKTNEKKGCVGKWRPMRAIKIENICSNTQRYRIIHTYIHSMYIFWDIIRQTAKCWVFVWKERPPPKCPCSSVDNNKENNNINKIDECCWCSAGLFSAVQKLYGNIVRKFLCVAQHNNNNSNMVIVMRKE